MADTQQTLYDAVGGMPFFEALVDRFYDGVQGDPVLLRLYPEPEDLAPARHKLTLFLAQYWGGPTTYHEERGHPALRMRHAPFAIGPRSAIAGCRDARRDRTMDPPEPVAEALHDYFDMAADSLRNHRSERLATCSGPEGPGGVRDVDAEVRDRDEQRSEDGHAHHHGEVVREIDTTAS